VSSKETRSRIFIDICLVEPEEYICPINIINTTGECVEITIPLVIVDKIRMSDRVSIFAL